jgi:hypothetical protein
MKEKLKELMVSGQFQIFEGSFFDIPSPVPLVTKDQLKEFKRIIIWVTNQYRHASCSGKGRGNFENKYLFDYYKDPIIELENCKISNRVISPGRIFYKAGWIDNADLRQLHEKAANKVRRLFNKGLSPLSPPFKISDGVKKLLLKGYEIELGEGGKKINQNNINGT